MMAVAPGRAFSIYCDALDDGWVVLVLVLVLVLVTTMSMFPLSSQPRKKEERICAVLVVVGGDVSSAP
jgi:hypothetical protein